MRIQGAVLRTAGVSRPYADGTRARGHRARARRPGPGRGARPDRRRRAVSLGPVGHRRVADPAVADAPRSRGVRRRGADRPGRHRCRGRRPRRAVVRAVVRPLRVVPVGPAGPVRDGDGDQRCGHAARRRPPADARGWRRVDQPPPRCLRLRRSRGGVAGVARPDRPRGGSGHRCRARVRRPDGCRRGRQHGVAARRLVGRRLRSGRRRPERGHGRPARGLPPDRGRRHRPGQAGAGPRARRDACGPRRRPGPRRDRSAS